MNSKIDNKDLARQHTKRLTNDEGNKTVAESGYTMPANKELSELWTESIPSLDLQVFIDAQEIGALYPISQNTAEWQDIETKVIQNALLNGESIDDALDEVAEEMDQILDDENN